MTDCQEIHTSFQVINENRSLSFGAKSILFLNFGDPVVIDTGEEFEMPGADDSGPQLSPFRLELGEIAGCLDTTVYKFRFPKASTNKKLVVIARV